MHTRGIVTRISSPVFVGREAELAELDQTWSEVKAGHGHIVLVSGESGIGKTRLLDEFAARAESSGGSAFRGACVDMVGGGVPFGPFVEGLSRAFRSGSIDPMELEPFTRRELSILVHGLGDDGSSVIDGPGDEFARARRFEAFANVYRTRAQRQPVVLVVDDLQWADPSSISLLLFLRRVAESEAMLILGSYRTDDFRRDDPNRQALMELSRRPGTRATELGTLPRSSTAELLAAMYGHPPSASLVDTVFDRSDGNPFIAQEIAHAIVTGDGHDIPPTIRESIMVRLAGLSQRTQEVAAAAGVAGRAIDDALLEAVTDLPAETLAASLRELVGAKILAQASPPDDLIFTHAITREVITRDLLPADLRRLHKRCAAVLEERLVGTGTAERLALIAHHRSEAGEPGRAVRALFEAARAMATAGAFEDASAFLERALDRWGLLTEVDLELLGADRAELLLHLAAAMAATGDNVAAARAARSAIEALDPIAAPERVGAAYLELADYLLQGYDTARLDAGRRALELLPRSPPTVARSQALRVVGSELLAVGDVEGLPFVAQAAEVAHAADAPADEALARAILAFSSSGTADRPSVVAAVRECLRAFAATDRSGELGIAYLNLITVLSILDGRLDEAAALGWEAWKVLSDRGSWGFIAADLIGAMAQTLIRLGHWEECDRYIRLAPPGGTHGPRLYLHQAAARVATFQGRLDEAREQIGAIQMAFDTANDDPQLTRAERELELELLLAGGRASQALTLWRSFPDLPVGFVTEWAQDAAVLRLAVTAGVEVGLRSNAAGEAEDALGAAAAARFAMDQLLAVDAVDRLDTPEIDALVATAEAELTRLDRRPGPAGWSRAFGAWAALGQPYPAAYCRYREAEALLVGGGDRRLAEEALRDAYTVARNLGAALLAGEVEDLARRGRMRLVDGPPAPAVVVVATPADPLGLTGREREVLELLVAGRTNREIGELLFISPKTAGVHVSNILGKLGATNRVEAASIAHRLRLFSEADRA